MRALFYSSLRCAAVPLGYVQSEDVLLWAMPEHPTWMSSASITDDGRCARVCMVERLSVPLSAGRACTPSFVMGLQG